MATAKSAGVGGLEFTGAHNTSGCSCLLSPTHEAMIPLVGRLYREKNISLYIYGKSMVNRSVIELMKAHRFVRQIEQNELSKRISFAKKYSTKLPSVIQSQISKEKNATDLPSSLLDAAL